MTKKETKQNKEFKCGVDREHRYYNTLFQKKTHKTCVICGFNPHFEKYEKKMA